MTSAVLLSRGVGEDRVGEVSEQAEVGGVRLWQLADTDADGLTLREQFGNGLETSRQWDRLRPRVIHTGTAAQPSLYQALTLEFDASGNLVERDDALAEAAREIVAPDALGRIDTITSGETGAVTLDMSYSASGSIDAKSDVGDYTYGGPQPDAVTQAGDVSYTYDAVGNPTSRDGQPITFTPFDAIRSLGAVRYEYDAFGTRVVRRGDAETTVSAGLCEVVVPAGATSA